jgi:hypothetical protein
VNSVLQVLLKMLMLLRIKCLLGFFLSPVLNPFDTCTHTHHRLFLPCGNLRYPLCRSAVLICIQQGLYYYIGVTVFGRRNGYLERCGNCHLLWYFAGFDWVECPGESHHNICLSDLHNTSSYSSCTTLHMKQHHPAYT